MGRIKSKLIKRTATKLKENIDLTPSFEENKLALKGLTSSKKLRNKIAGYISRLARRK